MAVGSRAAISALLLAILGVAYLLRPAPASSQPGSAAQLARAALLASNSTNSSRPKAADNIPGYKYSDGRGIVMVGDGCFVPLAWTSAYLLQQYKLNIKVALFTSEEGLGTAEKLSLAFGIDPFERVVDATALLDQHDHRLGSLGRNKTCAFRLQKIIAHIYAPYEHTLITDADNFPCSERVKTLFDVHDAAGSQAMLMYDPTRPGVFNGGFQLSKRTPEVRRFKVHWLKKVASSCDRGVHLRKVGTGVNYVLDQPDMNYLIQRWKQKVNSTRPFDVIPPDLQACRPEMWQGGNETERYLAAMGQPHNRTLLDYPPCPFAHINPFKFPWYIPEKVDRFCSARGLGLTSDVLYRVMDVAFADPAGLGINPSTAAWCRRQVRGTREAHDISPHFIEA